MIVSRITTQKKNKNRYNVFIKTNEVESFGFGVHEDLLIRHAIRKGMEISQSEIDEIKKQDAIHQYYTLSINYLSYRMRAESEMVDYLVKKEATEEEIAFVMEKLIQEKLIDDVAFSEAYVQTKINTTSKGPNKIKQELMQKKISPATIDGAMEKYSKEIEVEKAAKLLQKKTRSSNRESFHTQLNKAKQSMLQQGYQMDAIQMAVEEIDLEKDEDAEKEAVFYQGEKIWTKQARKHEGGMLIQKVKASLYQKGFQGDLIEQFIDEKMNEEVES
ncbi:recombination regulator RecX [Allobacillus sp. SKP2-8]|uniref:recombination regulator RecX n=1 Tax=unclassified Allobacillus TaxID=2628859 RepID=UPI001184351B|nr:recombination regulator RecX [Allobacillus sp. SKP2-8]TSJ66948.1 recombination regulator RecX [Allobacillus sp. SKP2-8]